MCEDADVKVREMFSFFLKVGITVAAIVIALRLKEVIQLLEQILEKL